MSNQLFDHRIQKKISDVVGGDDGLKSELQEYRRRVQELNSEERLDLLIDQQVKFRRREEETKLAIKIYLNLQPGMSLSVRNSLDKLVPSTEH